VRVLRGQSRAVLFVQIHIRKRCPAELQYEAVRPVFWIEVLRSLLPDASSLPFLAEAGQKYRTVFSDVFCFQVLFSIRPPPLRNRHHRKAHVSFLLLHSIGRSDLGRFFSPSFLFLLFSRLQVWKKELGSAVLPLNQKLGFFFFCFKLLIAPILHN